MKIMKNVSTMSDRNKKFWALPKEKQIVAIAKDVLKWLGTNKIKATTGTYLSTRFKSKINAKGLQLDKALEKVSSCNVCGIGACFFSMVALGNNISSEKAFVTKWNEEVDVLYQGQSIDDFEMRPLLRKAFRPSQLTLIECAFERNDTLTDSKDRTNNKEIISKAISFGGKFKAAKSRLAAIMQNIIKNKGEFKP